MSIQFLSKENGIKTIDATATSNDIINPKTAYVNNEKITGNIVPIYGEANPTIVQSQIRMQSESNMTIGFSRDAKFMFKLDYDTQELVIYNSILETPIELKRVSLSEFSITDTASYHARNHIVVSNYGACGNSECVYVFLHIESTNSYFVTTLHIPSLTFNYASGDYVGFWNLQNKGTLGAFSNQYPDRFISYNLSTSEFRSTEVMKGSLNADGTISGPWRIEYADIFGTPVLTNVCANGYFVNVIFGDANYTNPGWKSRQLYRSNLNDNGYFASSDDTLILSLNGQHAFDGTSIYECEINYSSGSITKTKLFDLDKTYNRYMFFIQDNVLVSLPNNATKFNTLVFTILDYENNTYVEQTVNLSKPLYCFGTTQANVIHLLNNELKDINVVVDNVLEGFNRAGNLYYNTTYGTAVSAEIMQNKTSYGPNGKIVGSMPNNGMLNYDSTSESLVIPAGYTSGGTIAPYPQSQEDYMDCIRIADDILGTYTNLELLHINNTKTIDLGIQFNINNTYKLKFCDATADAYEAYIGSSGNPNTFVARSGTSSSFAKSNAIVDLGAIPTSSPAEAVITFPSQNNSNLVLGTTVGSTATNADYDFYYLQVYNSNNILINNFVPVSTTDGKTGIYDKINGVFIEY